MMLLQVAVVMVSFPATPLLLARVRICISASHTKEDLVKALEVNSYIRFSFKVISVFILVNFSFPRCVIFIHIR